MFIVRRAKSEDVGALFELYMRHLTQTPPAEKQDLKKWSERLDGILMDGNYHLLVGELKGRVVSSATLVVIPNLTHNLRPYSIIENVVTHSDYRRRGFASDLIEKAKDIARGSGCYKIMLLTGAKDEATLRFYDSCGFNRFDKTGFLKKL